jgi:hypothetical protein
MRDCQLLHYILLAYEYETLTNHGINPLRYSTGSAYSKNSFLHGPHGLDHDARSSIHCHQIRCIHTTGSHGGRTQVLERGNIRITMEIQIYSCSTTTHIIQ